jgi:hypothetical protein
LEGRILGLVLHEDLPDGTHVSIWLRLDDEGRPVGSLRCGEGPEAPFAGWLALMAECSRLLGPSSKNAPGSSDGAR